MKKINNKKSVFLYSKILWVLLLLFFFVGIILWLLKPLPSHLLFVGGGCSIVFILVFYTLFKLKVFEYESSMLFISIKQSYLWKLNSSIKLIEFPNDILLDFDIRKEFFTTLLVIAIRSKKYKARKIYCKIVGLNNVQISELKQSLQKAKEYTKN